MIARSAKGARIRLCNDPAIHMSGLIALTPPNALNNEEIRESDARKECWVFSVSKLISILVKKEIKDRVRQ